VHLFHHYPHFFVCQSHDSNSIQHAWMEEGRKNEGCDMEKACREWKDDVDGEI
jgi:hypothetical protein